ncbi:MAG: hypothetical protein A3F17_01890 [Gammaproteobacteria bacterium RIFCSPHIGHO2_12_FULL_41_15]|nr:MAG: hypothetical protein A3F17_01890 [Gammaproteobacteria bacterium RIFCSPHIGHO2_12_FULL_41_15]
MSSRHATTVSATHFVRHFAETLETVRATHTTLYITKGTRVVAQLCPPPAAGFPISSLTNWLLAMPKLGEDHIDMENDIKKIKQRAKLSGNPWE